MGYTLQRRKPQFMQILLVVIAVSLLGALAAEAYVAIDAQARSAVQR